MVELPARKGAASLADLRAMPPGALQPSEGANALRFGPVADGALLPTGPWKPVSDVPVLAALYPTATDNDRSTANRQIRRDRTMAGLYAWNRRRAASSHAPAYAYLFAYVMPGAGSEHWDAFHSSEIPYVFQTFAASPEWTFTPADRRLSATASAYWANFIATGNPNKRPAGGKLPLWPALGTGATPHLLRLGDSVVAQPLLGPRLLDLTRADLAADGGLNAF